MAKSFFRGTDAELYSGSNNFSTRLTATPLAYGITALLAASYASLNTTYAAAYLASITPATRTKAAVAARRQAKIPLKLMASDLAKIIAGTPTVTDQQKIELGLNVRATPTPVGPPGTATDFKAVLPGDGSLELTWKCKNPAGSNGTIYQVWRRVGGSGEFTFLGGTGRKKFTDTTLPAGASSVTYQIQAVRSTAAGAWAQFNVNFGVAAGGQITSADVEAPKLAA